MPHPTAGGTRRRYSATLLIVRDSDQSPIDSTGGISSATVFNVTGALVTKRHRGDHNRAARQNVSAHAFMQNQPSQKDRNHRIDVCVRRNFRRRHVIQQPDVGRVAHPRSEDDEVEHGAYSTHGPHGS